MTSRLPYREYPGMLDRVTALLDVVFPGIAGVMQAALPLGLRWDECSTPFLRLVDGEPVAHLGLLEVPLVMEGRTVLAGAIHGVATHPGHRRRGYFRELMQDCLRWCDGRYETLFLTTGQPEIYEPFSFRVVQEHRFVGACVCSSSHRPFRELDRADPGDAERLQRLLRERAPVSEILGVVRELHSFAFYAAERAVYLADDEDLYAVYTLEGKTLRLYDVIARDVAPLAEVVARIPQAIDHVEVYFAPDRLRAELTAEPHLLNGDDHLLVRGRFPPTDTPLMLPLMNRA